MLACIPRDITVKYNSKPNATLKKTKENIGKKRT